MNNADHPSPPRPEEIARRALEMARAAARRPGLWGGREGAYATVCAAADIAAFAVGLDGEPGHIAFIERARRVASRRGMALNARALVARDDISDDTLFGVIALEALVGVAADVDRAVAAYQRHCHLT